MPVCAKQHLYFLNAIRLDEEVILQTIIIMKCYNSLFLRLFATM
jgi:hypothetical protein